MAFFFRPSLDVSAATASVGVDLSIRPKRLACLNGLGADTWVRPDVGDREFFLGCGASHTHTRQVRGSSSHENKGLAVSGRR